MTGQNAMNEPLQESSAKVDSALRSILRDVLGLEQAQVDEFDADAGLFGHLPELDSMAVAGLLTEMEDQLDITIDDDDIDGEMLETFGGLLEFAEDKVAQGKAAQEKAAETKATQA
jgi:acyl carrier protein